MPSGVLRVLGVHTGSAREAREHQGADPEAKGGAVTIPVYRRRHRGTERGRATFPGHAGQWGGEAAGGREAWLQMVPLGRASAWRRPAPLQREGQPQRCCDPVSRVLGLSGRRRRLPGSEAGTSASPPGAQSSARSGRRPPRLRVLGLGRAWFFHRDRCPASAPGWPRPVHPAARRSDFLLFTDPTGAS